MRRPVTHRDDGELERIAVAWHEELDEISGTLRENVATTQAEYLDVAYDMAGFDTLTEAAEHATDALLVKNAYGGTTGC